MIGDPGAGLRVENKNAPPLNVTDLSIAFGGVRAVQNVSFTAQPVTSRA